MVVIKPVPPCCTDLLTQARRFLYRSLHVIVPLFYGMYVRFQPYRNGNLSGTLICSKKKKSADDGADGHGPK